MPSGGGTVENGSSTKRKASATGAPVSHRPIKRRASRACCCCRARKVRCDVVESGAPCTNCRLDQVECVVTESKRRKKSRTEVEGGKPTPESSGEFSEDHVTIDRRSSNSRQANNVENGGSMSPPQLSVDLDHDQHMPHLIYQTQASRIDSDAQLRRRLSIGQNQLAAQTFGLGSGVADTIQQLLGPDLQGNNGPRLRGFLPDFIRGLPQRLLSEDIDYLAAKGALTVPEPELRDELLKSYINYVHAFMPILDLDQFLLTIARNDGIHRMSLLLFQAVMFAGSAYIDIEHLRAAGYANRKAARKAFFQRARLLYDFDYEADRISLVQSLLLMTTWYETPDDQKDTWHWMGVSLSLAHTIGLHRDPANSNMDPRRKTLWKRLWWSTYTRDRLIALGMRRPMRIKDEDCDVSLLTLDDFEFGPFSSEVMHMLGDCEILQNVRYQHQLATMFIEKSKLCLCVSRVLSVQYSVLSHRLGGSMETTMMLVPKKSVSEAHEVRRCDEALEEWHANLPAEAQYHQPASRTLSEAEEAIQLHSALLYMIYLTTSSALHRPQVLPASPYPAIEADLQDLSRVKVRHAAVEITNTARTLYKYDLIRFLPTTGVTVIVPAVIIHLLDIKSNDPAVRLVSLQRFHQCMRILQRLRETYASADFATSFLEAAIHKAGIQMPMPGASEAQPRPAAHQRTHTLTPPPDFLPQKVSDLSSSRLADFASGVSISEDGVATMIEASTPPDSVGSDIGSTQNLNLNGAYNPFQQPMNPDMTLNEFMDLANDVEVTQNDFDALINFDDNGADLFVGGEEGMAVDNRNIDLGGMSFPDTTFSQDESVVA